MRGRGEEREREGRREEDERAWKRMCEREGERGRKCGGGVRKRTDSEY